MVVRMKLVCGAHTLTCVEEPVAAVSPAFKVSRMFLAALKASFFEPGW